MTDSRDTPDLLDAPSEPTLLAPQEEIKLLDARDEEKLLDAPDQELLLAPPEEEKLLSAWHMEEGIPATPSEMTPPSWDDIPPLEEVTPREVPTPPVEGVLSNPVENPPPHQETITEKKSHGLIWWIIILCGAVLLGWIGYIILSWKDPKTLLLDFTVEKQEVKPSYEETLAEQKKQAENDILFANQARDTRDTRLCEKIASTESRAECQENLVILSAIDTKNPELCNSVTNTGSRAECHDTIGQRAAIEAKNTSLCTSLSTESKKTYCQETIEKDLLKNILESGTASEEVCSILITEAKQSCMDVVVNKSNEALLQNALATDTRETCESLTAGELRDYCYDTITLKQALTSRDASLCDGIKNSDKKSQCKTELVIKNETEKFREYVSALDLNGCATLTDTTLKNRCHDTVTLSLVRENKDITLCETLTAANLWDACRTLAQ